MPSLLERLRDALAPRYEIEGEVASGGMATVFRAHDTSLDRPVAVKCPTATDDPIRRERFLVEAMAPRAVGEFIVGVKRDPQFGLALVIGAGGILVELLGDAATLLLPVTLLLVFFLLFFIVFSRLMFRFGVKRYSGFGG